MALFLSKVVSSHAVTLHAPSIRRARASRCACGIPCIQTCQSIRARMSVCRAIVLAAISWTDGWSLLSEDLWNAANSSGASHVGATCRAIYGVLCSIASNRFISFMAKVKENSFLLTDALQLSCHWAIACYAALLPEALKQSGYEVNGYDAGDKTLLQRCFTLVLSVPALSLMLCAASDVLHLLFVCSAAR